MSLDTHSRREEEHQAEYICCGSGDRRQCWEKGVGVLRSQIPLVCQVNNCRYDQNRTLVIDVGKNFQAAAIEWFPKYGLREIDAVLITHAHADGGSI